MRRLWFTLLYRTATWAWWLLIDAMIMGSWVWDDIRDIVDTAKGWRKRHER